MATMKMPCAVGSGGGISSMDILVGAMQITSSNTYTFTENHAYVMVLTYGAGTLQYYRFNGSTVPADALSDTASGSMISASYPTDCLVLFDVKSGDILSSADNITTTIIALN